VTPAAPTWGEIEEFLKIDGWEQLAPSARGGSSQDHIFFEKLLEDGRVLVTHISHSRKKRPSPGRFSLILRDQIEVSRNEFWAALQSGKPVARPVPLESEEVVEHEPWVVETLARDAQMSPEEIDALSPEEAREIARDPWTYKLQQEEQGKASSRLTAAPAASPSP
jgi:hypothetical protein